MEVTKTIGPALTTPARTMTTEAMPGKILSFLRRYYGEITCYMWPLE